MDGREWKTFLKIESRGESSAVSISAAHMHVLVDLMILYFDWFNVVYSSSYFL